MLAISSGYKNDLVCTRRTMSLTSFNFHCNGGLYYFAARGACVCVCVRAQRACVCITERERESHTEKEKE